MMMQKPIIILAMALVFSGLQCAAWCTVGACDLTQLSGSGSHNVPPCHRHQSDSSKNSPANPCPHAAVIRGVAGFSAAQEHVAAPLVAILPIQPAENARVLISGHESKVSTTSPPGSGGPSSLVLRI